jgi:hypothetical protein
MKDTFIHEDDTRFDEFVEETLKGLSERAEEHGICVECLSDRLIVELVSGLARSGVAASAILGMVGDGMDAAEADADSEREGQSRRMH